MLVHGYQNLAPHKRRLATKYYNRDSGVGVTLRRLAGDGPLRVGTIAAYGRERDYYRFYEINPDVLRLATKWSVPPYTASGVNMPTSRSGPTSTAIYFKSSSSSRCHFSIKRSASSGVVCSSLTLRSRSSMRFSAVAKSVSCRSPRGRPLRSRAILDRP